MGKRENGKHSGSTGTIEVDMFGEEVDGADHPEAATLKLLLEQVADEYECRLLSFEVKRGTASFSFDSELLTAQIVKILQENSAGQKS